MRTMKRIRLLCSILAALMIGAGFVGRVPVTAEEAEKKETKRIGVLQFADHPSLLNCYDGLIAGLADEGYAVGENLEVDYQVAKADMALNIQMASDMAAQNYDLVVGIATPSAQALYNAAKDRGIPVLFNAVTDPAAAGLALSSGEEDEVPAEDDYRNQPGVTGISDRLPIRQQLRLIRRFLPEAERIGILYTGSEANSVASVKRYERLAPEYGFKIVAQSISDTADLPLAADELLRKVDLLTNLTDNTVVNNQQTVLAKALQAGIPYFGSEEEQVRQGLLAAAGLDYFALGLEVGDMAAEIFDGNAPETIRIEVVTDTDIFYNSATLEALGLELPADFRDDEGKYVDGNRWYQDNDDDSEDNEDGEDGSYFYIRDVNPVVEEERGVTYDERNVERNRWFAENKDKKQ